MAKARESPSGVLVAARCTKAMAPYLGEWKQEAPNGAAVGVYSAVQDTVHVKVFSLFSEALEYREGLDADQRSTASVIPFKNRMSLMLSRAVSR